MGKIILLFIGLLALDFVITLGLCAFGTFLVIELLQIFGVSVIFTWKLVWIVTGIVFILNSLFFGAIRKDK